MTTRMQRRPLPPIDGGPVLTLAGEAKPRAVPWWCWPFATDLSRDELAALDIGDDDSTDDTDDQEE